MKTKEDKVVVVCDIDGTIVPSIFTNNEDEKGYYLTDEFKSELEKLSVFEYCIRSFELITNRFETQWCFVTGRKASRYENESRISLSHLPGEKVVFYYGEDLEYDLDVFVKWKADMLASIVFNTTKGGDKIVLLTFEDAEEVHDIWKKIIQGNSVFHFLVDREAPSEWWKEVYENFILHFCRSAPNT